MFEELGLDRRIGLLRWDEEQPEKFSGHRLPLLPPGGGAVVTCSLLAPHFEHYLAMSEQNPADTEINEGMKAGTRGTRHTEWPSGMCRCAAGGGGKSAFVNHQPSRNPERLFFSRNIDILAYM